MKLPSILSHGSTVARGSPSTCRRIPAPHRGAARRAVDGSRGGCGGKRVVGRDRRPSPEATRGGRSRRVAAEAALRRVRPSSRSAAGTVETARGARQDRRSRRRVAGSGRRVAASIRREGPANVLAGRAPDLDPGPGKEATGGPALPDRSLFRRGPSVPGARDQRGAVGLPRGRRRPAPVHRRGWVDDAYRRRVPPNMNGFDGDGAPGGASLSREGPDGGPPGATTTIVLMGVSGSGKSSVMRKLARGLAWPAAEGDAFHSPENVEKMRNGVPLTDGDRLPWLEALAPWIGERERAGENALVTCSALKREY